MNPCKDRHGNTFRSQSDCARYHGLDVSTVSAHLNKHGNLDRLGVGMGKKGTPSATFKPIEIDGRSWESQAELARHIDVNQKTLSRWITKGHMDLIRRKLEAAQ